MMRWTFRAALAAGFVVSGMAAGSVGRAGAQTAPPNPCSLLSKAEMQALTGNADAMSFPNQPDKMGAGAVCTIHGGGKNNLGFEFILYVRTRSVPLTTPPKAEPLTGIGEGAYIETTPGNAAAFAVKGLYLLRVGAQSSGDQQALKTVTAAVTKAAVAKLP
jgi:hypothetical protein